MRRVVSLLMVCFQLVTVALFLPEAEREAEAGLRLGSILPVFVGPVTILPPVVRFGERGSMHLAWFQKVGSVGVSWTEHAFPMNRILLQQGTLTLTAMTGQP